MKLVNRSKFFILVAETVNNGPDQEVNVRDGYEGPVFYRGPPTISRVGV